jgi:IclR family acetate operon transcriptional repressor
MRWDSAGSDALVFKRGLRGHPKYSILAASHTFSTKLERIHDRDGPLQNAWSPTNSPNTFYTYRMVASNGMLDKGLTLLEALAEHPQGTGVSQVAREVGLPASTAHRLLANLVERGFVSFDSDSRRYYLGLKIFELSNQVALARALSEVALPAMRRLAKATGESVFLAVRDGTDLVYIERVGGESRIQITGAIGSRGPLYCTAQGKAILAFLPESEQAKILTQIRLEPRAPNTITDPRELRKELQRTRERGWAVADEENQEGIRAVGVALINYREQPLAAMSVAAPTFRVSLARLEEFAPLLIDAARKIQLQAPDGAGGSDLRFYYSRIRSP